MVRESRTELHFSSAPRLVEQVAQPIDRSEVLRYLGYPEGVQPRPHISRAVDAWIEESRQLAEPRAIYWLLPVVAKEQRRLCLESPAGVTEFRGAIGEFLGVSQAVAVFIATAGPRVERRASELMRQRDELGAMVLNAVGAERAEAAEAVVIAELREAARPAGLAPTLPYSPGYCGMALLEQKKLFGLLDGAAVGVTLTSKCLMRPIKSISGLIGLGAAADVAGYGSPCDRCELHNCNMRR
jgi:hypothetical protein